MSIPLKRLTHHAKKCLEEAEKIAFTLGDPLIQPEHLFLAISLRQGSAGSAFLLNMGITKESLSLLLQKKDTQTEVPSFQSKNPQELQVKIAPSLKKILLSAYKNARLSQSPYVGSEHILKALIESKHPAIQDILSYAIKRKKHTQPHKSQKNPKPSFFKTSEFPSQFFGEVSDEQEMSALEEFCVNLNERALEKKDLPLIGREEILKRITRILGRKTKNNALLIGDPGVGKTAIVAGLAEQISRGILPSLRGKIIYEVDLAMIISGTSFRGEFEARLKDIILEASKDPHIILFIDEIHTLIGTGNISGSLDAANILKPALARGEIRCIGATTATEYKKHIEKDSALARRFQSVNVEEPTREQAIIMLQGLRKSMENHHGVLLSDEVITCCVDLSIRHMHDRFLPDKAIDILDEASSAKRLEKLEKNPGNSEELFITRRLIEDAQLQKNACIEKEQYETALKFNLHIETLRKKIIELEKKIKRSASTKKIPLSKEDIAHVISGMTSIPTEKILSQHTSKIASLKESLNKKIVGQEHAVDIITKSLTRSFFGLSDTTKPLGSFLLLGPSGVGKTYTAKILAQHLFNRKDAIIRIDMSEFRERHHISGFIGAPAGYIGYGEGGKFTERVRKNPHSVILFDEIEKAHPDILNILLQILEEGSLTDGEGRNVSLRESIILFTSNIGSHYLRELSTKKLGFEEGGFSSPLDIPLFEKKVREDLQNRLRPELLDRLDHIIVYRPLAKEHIQMIVTFAMEEIASRLHSRGYNLNWNTSVLSELTKKATIAHTGARQVRKIIQEHIEDLLAEYLLKNKHSSSITLKMKNGTIILT
ncbi:MAG: ATP-dependent Clp protease ATP-binding subunit [Candidatus Moranbacteria bacterium]|nr:ATP-dependent Clp protease ATP-binding subunit [Candidatus Moranbacteria bacterium]